jgi:hypothetical protein
VLSGLEIAEMGDCLIAYLAGVLDVGGSIGIVKTSNRTSRGTSRGSTYSEHVIFRQVTPSTVDLLHATFGGTRHLSKPPNGKGAVQHTWQVSNLKAASCLQALRPYLRARAEHADNCLALTRMKALSAAIRRASAREVPLSPEAGRLQLEVEQLYLRAHQLNRRRTSSD